VPSNLGESLGRDAVSRSGPWTSDEVDAFLAAAVVPIRLSCNGSSGFPVMASFWFVPLGGRLWCATQRSARVARLLSQDGRCAFEVSEERPPYRGVRGQAVATLDDSRGVSVLGSAMRRYGVDPESAFAAWLLGRAEAETAIAIEPRSIVSWDYRARMSELES
jgi:hypothetical protein